MVKLMVNELFRWQDEDAKFGGGFEACMSSILKAQEKAGMAPPFYDKIQDNNGEKVLIPVREWEDEM